MYGKFSSPFLTPQRSFISPMMDLNASPWVSSTYRGQGITNQDPGGTHMGLNVPSTDRDKSFKCELPKKVVPFWWNYGRLFQQEMTWRRLCASYRKNKIIGLPPRTLRVPTCAQIWHWKIIIGALLKSNSNACFYQKNVKFWTLSGLQFQEKRLKGTFRIVLEDVHRVWDLEYPQYLSLLASRGCQVRRIS